MFFYRGFGPRQPREPVALSNGWRLPEAAVCELCLVVLEV